MPILLLFLIGTNGLLAISCSGDDGRNGINGIEGSKGDKGDKGTDGANCDVEDDDAYFVMKCGEVEKSRWAKAMCGKTAYDPVVMECSLIRNTLSFRFVDERDGKVYKALIVGSQIWMAENMNYVYESDTLSKCYNDSITNCYKYGRLYNWETARTICPEGWHLPTDAEWNELYRNADGDSGTYSPYNSPTAGKYLKTRTCNGTDEFGFAALPGGYGTSEGFFYNAGYSGYWWSATEYSYYHLNAHYRYMLCEEEFSNWSFSYKKNFYSVRCVKD